MRSRGRGNREGSGQHRALESGWTGLLERARASMDETTFRRAAHVVAENARPQSLARALAANDLAAAGQVML